MPEAINRWENEGGAIGLNELGKEPIGVHALAGEETTPKHGSSRTRTIRTAGPTVTNCSNGRGSHISQEPERKRPARSSERTTGDWLEVG